MNVNIQQRAPVQSNAYSGYHFVKIFCALGAFCHNLSSIFKPDKIIIGDKWVDLQRISHISLDFSNSQLVCQIQFFSKQTRVTHLLLIMKGKKQQAGTCASVSITAQIIKTTLLSKSFKENETNQPRQHHNLMIEHLKSIRTYSFMKH